MADFAGEQPAAETEADVLRLALTRPPSFRPDEVVLTDQSAVIVSDLLYDGLTEAVGNDGELRPGLALDWSPNDDFSRWTFHLDPRSGVTAEVVADSLRWFTGNNGASRAGAAAVLAADIRAVEVEDRSTVVIELNSSNAGLPWVLSGLPFSIIGPSDQPTGDYEVASDSVDEDGLVLQRRDVRQRPDLFAPDIVPITWVDDEREGPDLVVAGAVDVGVADESFDSVPGATAVAVPATVAVRFYVLNSRSEGLSEPESRRTILKAIDREELVDLSAHHQPMPVDGLLGSSMTGYRPGACSSVCADGRPVHDATEATPATVQVSYSGVDQWPMATAMVEQLRAAGFGTELSDQRPRDLAAQIVSGDTDMFSFGWVAPATSSDAVVPPLLTIDSPANVARIDSPAVADLLATAAVTADDERRWKILDEAHRLALAEALILPIAGSTSMLIHAQNAPLLAVRADGSIDLDSMV